MTSNRFKIVEDEFMIQHCYYIDDVINFNIGYKYNDIWIYESGSYYKFDNHFAFDNTERKNIREVLHKKIIDNKDYIINEIKELINEEEGTIILKDSDSEYVLNHKGDIISVSPSDIVRIL